LEKSIRLSPRDPFLYLWYFRLGALHFFQDRLDEALLWLEKARRANPPSPPPHALLAAASVSRAIWLAPPLSSAKPTRREGGATMIGSGQSPSSKRTVT
jgi:hypothetical protein